jgi:hypothetical protein
MFLESGDAVLSMQEIRASIGCHPSGFLFVIMLQANRQHNSKCQAKNTGIHFKK